MSTKIYSVLVALWKHFWKELSTIWWNIVFVASLPMTYVLESTSYSCNILNSISVQFNSPIKARGLSLIWKRKHKIIYNCVYFLFLNYNKLLNLSHMYRYNTKVHVCYIQLTFEPNQARHTGSNEVPWHHWQIREEQEPDRDNINTTQVRMHTNVYPGNCYTRQAFEIIKYIL